MSVFCPECETSVPLPEDLVESGVSKVRCADCGSRFLVLPGGATLLLVAGFGGQGSAEELMPPRTEEEPDDSPVSDSELDGADAEELETDDVRSALEDLLSSVEDMRRKVQLEFGIGGSLLDALSSAVDEPADGSASAEDEGAEETASRDRQIAMLLDCQGSAYGLVQAAEKLHKLGAADEVMSMIARAEAECEDALDWLSCAEFWVDRDNKTAATHCLEAADRTDMDGEQSVWAAGLWARLGAGRDRQIKVLFVSNGSGYCTADRAEALLELQEPELARELLHKAERDCDDAFDWTRCAKVWRALEDREGVQRCLEAAEQADPDAEDIERMGGLWDYLGTGDDRRLELLAGDIRSAYDVVERVEGLLKLQAPDRARELIVRAEATCDDALQWLYCARAWRLLDEEQNIRACLQRAEDEGMDWEDTETALELCQELGGSHEQQIGLLRRCTGAGYSAGSAARALHEMNEPAAARELMASAEAGSDEGLDWLFCADAWFDIGDREACERCLARAQSYSLDGEESEMAVALREKLDRAY